MTRLANQRSMGLYIHVPFCGSICSYCHFARTADHQQVVRARYVEAVIREFDLRRQSCAALRSGRPLGTAYIGGGTPSELEPELMQRLLAGTVGRLPTTADFELTCEANPESFDQEKAQSWLAAGVNRVSLGVQSLNHEALRLLSRQCSPEAARSALRLACATFERVSADWIIGPGLAKDLLLAELSEAVALGVEHFSVYILELHTGTKLQQDVQLGRVVPATDEETEAQYLAVVDHLGGYGIGQYEVSNFARGGAESRHNRNYWRGVPWLGLGASAHGYWGKRRYGNHAELETYLAAVENGRLPEEVVDPLDLEARLLERVILALRTVDGVPLGWLPPDALDWAQGVADGLWIIRESRLVLTAQGFLKIDGIEEVLCRGIGTRARQ